MADWPYNTAAWRKLRALKLSEQPVCEACRRRGITAPARAVDHMKAISAGGEPFPPLDRLMSLCIRCHNEKTAAVDRGSSKPFSRRFKGFDADGNPVDPSDDWHRGGVEDEKALGRRPFGESSSYLVSDPDGGGDGA